MKKILIICNDIIGHKMAGPAIRCVELAKGLSKKFSVVLSAEGENNCIPENIKIISSDKLELQKEIQSCHFVIIQGNSLENNRFIIDANVVVIADLYCPIPLEYHISSSNENEDMRMFSGWNSVATMQEQIMLADFFICANSRQRDFWMGALTVLGRVNAKSMPNLGSSNINRFLEIIPFGLSDNSPIETNRKLRNKFNISEEAFVLVWGGGIYQWFDPLTIIKAIAKLDSEKMDVHLVFIGVKHPNSNIVEHDKVSEAINLSKNLKLYGVNVHFNFDWIDYNDRHNYLLDADVGVSSHFSNIETEYSFRTRILDYLWCNLPIISTRGDFFGNLVAEKNVGISVDYEDVDGWVDAIKKLYSNKHFYKNCKQNLSLISEEYKWGSISDKLAKRIINLEKSNDKDFIYKKYILMRIRINNANIINKVINFYRKNGVLKTFKKIISKVS